MSPEIHTEAQRRGEGADVPLPDLSFESAWADPECRKALEDLDRLGRVHAPAPELDHADSDGHSRSPEPA